MFTVQPPPEEALWFMEWILFGWYWHPFYFFGYLLSPVIALITVNAVISLVSPPQLDSPCNYPNCDGGPATGYCHTNCQSSSVCGSCGNKKE